MKILFTAIVVVFTLLTMSVQANENIEQLAKHMLDKQMEQVNLTLTHQVREDINYATYLFTMPTVHEPITLMANNEANMNKATDSE